jgi:curved DNA-binding protein CbpA
MPRTKSQAYTVLGVSPNATAAQLKKAWRDLARKHHPDAIPPPSGTMKDIMGDEKAMAAFMAKKAKYEALQKEATDRMQEINAAWDLLKG